MFQRYRGGMHQESSPEQTLNKHAQERQTRMARIRRRVVRTVPLRMTGAFSVKGERPLKYVEFKVDQESWPPKFYKFVLEFSEWREVLGDTDPRRFGRVQVRNECPRKSAPVNKLGFDPYLERISETEFEKILETREAIKSVCWIKGRRRGSWNWMADEMLYRAKIHPEVKASELNGEVMRSLREAMFDVTRVAVESADSGRFPSDWLFHHRWGKNQNAKMANGEKISFCEVGGERPRLWRRGRRR